MKTNETPPRPVDQDAHDAMVTFVAMMRHKGYDSLVILNRADFDGGAVHSNGDVVALLTRMIFALTDMGPTGHAILESIPDLHRRIKAGEYNN